MGSSRDAEIVTKRQGGAVDRRCRSGIGDSGLVNSSGRRGGAITDHQVITLWPHGAPGAKGKDPEHDIPTLTAWIARPDSATGAAVVVCPGGGYGMLAVDHEGKQVAEWLNSLGVSAFVLKYRLGPRYHHPAMLQDAARAIRTVRAARPPMGRRPAQDRHSRVFCGRASRLDGRYPL